MTSADDLIKELREQCECGDRGECWHCDAARIVQALHDNYIYRKAQVDEIAGVIGPV